MEKEGHPGMNIGNTTQVGVTPGEAFGRAIALQKEGNLLAAEKIYRAILKQYPKHFSTLSNLGFVLLDQERMEEAISFLRKALNEKPNSAVVHTRLARALQLLDRHEEAERRLKRAIALNPEFAEVHATLGLGLADLGRYDEAAAALARAIDLAPDWARLYYFWGHIVRWSADDPRLAALEALAQKSAELPPADRVDLKFALAKAYTDLGDIDRAFRCQIEGGALQRRLIRYDEASVLRELDELSRALDANWLKQHPGAGNPSPLPVFIVGMPRSGTSLVEQILASHPKVRALGERLTFNQSLANICGSSTLPPGLGQRTVQWSDAQLRKLGDLYLKAIGRDVPAAAARATDKLPANFQHLGLIHAALPNARVIHTRRDPIDTCLSLFSVLFSGPGQPYSYDLGDLGRYYRAYEKVMAHWRSILPAGVMLEVQYEHIVDDLEGQARRIVAHCGLVSLVVDSAVDF
jgi:tetratricopeptide (TPR) repeat protein